VLDLPVHTSSADLVSEAVAEPWEHIGFVRIDARRLAREGNGRPASSPSCHRTSPSSSAATRAWDSWPTTPRPG
jgi:hypothetical protein